MAIHVEGDGLILSTPSIAYLKCSGWVLSAAEGLVMWPTAVGGKSKSDARKSSDFDHGAGQWTR
jgi:hypothetical protein